MQWSATEAAALPPAPDCSVRRTAFVVRDRHPAHGDRRGSTDRGGRQVRPVRDPWVHRGTSEVDAAAGEPVPCRVASAVPAPEEAGACPAAAVHRGPVAADPIAEAPAAEAPAVAGGARHVRGAAADVPEAEAAAVHPDPVVAPTPADAAEAAADAPQRVHHPVSAAAAGRRQGRSAGAEPPGCPRVRCRWNSRTFLQMSARRVTPHPRFRPRTGGRRLGRSVLCSCVHRRVRRCHVVRCPFTRSRCVDSHPSIGDGAASVRVAHRERTTARGGSSCRFGIPRPRGQRIPPGWMPGGSALRECARNRKPARVCRRRPTTQ